MRELARVKIAFRTYLEFNPERRGKIDERHLLGYPVTHHFVQAWGGDSRLANQLRFRVHESAGRYVGVAFHVPCALPSHLRLRLDLDTRQRLPEKEPELWAEVHSRLDQEMKRLPGR